MKARFEGALTLAAPIRACNCNNSQIRRFSGKPCFRCVARLQLLHDLQVNEAFADFRSSALGLALS
jgi:hypothetical protein